MIIQMASKDKNLLTAKSREVRFVKNLLKNVPDERDSRVVSLKSDIKKGSYKVNVEAVAEKIIERTIKDSAIKNKSRKK